MKKITTVEAATLPIVQLKLTRLDSALNEIQESFNLVLDFNAIAMANAHLGRDLVMPESWQNLSSDQITYICWCAVQRFHPDVTLEQVRAMLPPGQIGLVFTSLLEMCFPGIIERMEKAAAARAAEGKPPDPTPAGAS